MQLLDFEKSRKEVLAVLAGKVNTVIAIKVVEALKKATIEAEPVRHGEWDAKIMKDIGTYTVYWCSECNCYSYFKYNYCPNCGAKMQGGSDE